MVLSIPCFVIFRQLKNDSSMRREKQLHMKTTAQFQECVARLSRIFAVDRSGQCRFARGGPSNIACVLSFHTAEESGC